MFYKHKKHFHINKQGQAVVEYIMVLAVFVVVTVYGFNMLKCRLHKIWVKTACNIIYPYPASMTNDLDDYCAPIDSC